MKLQYPEGSPLHRNLFQTRHPGGAGVESTLEVVGGRKSVRSVGAPRLRYVNRLPWLEMCRFGSSGARATDRGTFTGTGMILLALPLDIWEIIFELLPGQALQLISKVGSSTPSRSLTCSLNCSLSYSGSETTCYPCNRTKISAQTRGSQSWID